MCLDDGCSEELFAMNNIKTQVVPVMVVITELVRSDHG